MNQTATDFFWFYFLVLFFCDFLMIVRVNLIKLLQDTDNITMATCTLTLTLLVHVKVLLNLP